MSTSTHNMRLTATDATAGAFSSISAKAASAGASIRNVLGGALAAVGAYMSFRSVIAGVNELGHLSDIAQKTGTNVSELTQLSTGLNALGIQRVGIDELGKAFDYMQKTTGRAGLQGFYQTIAELAKIPDTAKRGQEAMRIFGRTGMEMMPLIAGAAQNGIDALEGVVNAMPGISDAAANAGDSVADSMDIVAKGLKATFYDAIGFVCSLFGEDVRNSAAAMAATVQYYAKVAASYLVLAFRGVQDAIENATSFAATFVGSIASGNGVGASFAAAKEQAAFEMRASETLRQEDAKRAADALAAAKAEYDRKRELAKQLTDNYNKAAVKAEGGGAADAAKAEKSVARETRLTNALVEGGSYAALKMSLSQEGEQAKQTNLLKQIAENTATTKANAADLETIEGE